MHQDEPIILRRPRCPKCGSTNVPVYRTLDCVQYRRCRYCASLGIKTTLKTVLEPARPIGKLEGAEIDNNDPPAA